MKWVPIYDTWTLGPNLNGKPVVLLMDDGSVVWGEFNAETDKVGEHSLYDATYIAEVFGG